MIITKTIAANVASSMTQPMLNKIESLHKEIITIANEAVRDNTPKDLKEVFPKYRSYFESSTSVSLHNGSESVRIEKLDAFPATGSWYPAIEVGPDVVKAINKIKLKIEKIEDKRSKTFNSIISTLISIRTTKRCQEQFPEAYKYIEEIEKTENATTELSLPIDKILKEIASFT